MIALLYIYFCVCCERMFKIGEDLAKLQARKLIVSRALCSRALFLDEVHGRDLKYDGRKLLLTVVSLFGINKISNPCRPISVDQFRLAI